MEPNPDRKPDLDALFGAGAGVSVVRSNADPLTEEAYGDLALAMGYFNERLFDGALSGCILGFGRMKNVLGYFCPDRFEDATGRLAHEISLNPAYLRLRSDRETLSTLVHEMCHHWRHDHGPMNAKGGKGAPGYHDKAWALKMIELGLMPTDTGLPGGRVTGYHMTHLIIPGGQFDLDCAELLASGFRIRWHDRAPLSMPVPDEDAEPVLAPKKAADRVKFTCPDCGQNAWAKPTARLACGPCGLPLDRTLMSRR